MKHGAEAVAEWPMLLEQIRALCRFFKVEDWRKTITRMVVRDHPWVAELLKRFTATLAKWRYETLWEALTQLLRL